MFVRIIGALALAFLLPLSVQAAPTCVQGVAGAAPTATISFTPPTLNTDGTAVATPLTYTLFASTTSGAEVAAKTGLTGSPISVSTGLTPNMTAYFYVVVVDANGKQSLPSNEVCKAFPASTPGTVTITIS